MNEPSPTRTVPDFDKDFLPHAADEIYRVMAHLMIRIYVGEFNRTAFLPSGETISTFYGLDEHDRRILYSRMTGLNLIELENGNRYRLRGMPRPKSPVTALREQIGADIKDGIRKPGEPLSWRRVMQTYGVPRDVAVAAIHQLSNDPETVIVNKQTFVAPPQWVRPEHVDTVLHRVGRVAGLIRTGTLKPERKIPEVRNHPEVHNAVLAILADIGFATKDGYVKRYQHPQQFTDRDIVG